MDLVLRATVIFLVIWMVTRVVGRRELSSMEPFDLILLIVIGDMVQGAVTQSDQSVTGALVVIFTLSLLTVGTSWLSFRFRPLRPLFEGEPIVLLQDGEPIMANLRRERINLDELRTEARINEIDDLADVRFAVLETNGTISFVTHPRSSSS